MINYKNISQKLKEKGAPFFDMLGINAFSVRRFYRNGTIVYLSTLPEWFQFYQQHKFYKLGEFNKALSGRPTFRLWDYWDPNDKDFWTVINPAKNYFNQNHGLCYIKKNRQYMDVVNFGADEKDHTINQRYLNEKERISNFYDFFDITTIDDLVGHAPKFKNDNFKEKIYCEKQTAENLMSDLSPQEARTISFWTKGYSLKQIALFMSLSPRTIESYINRVKVKYNFRYKTEFIKKYNFNF